MIEIVSATLRSEAEFRAHTALGQSLQRLSFDERIIPRIYCNNHRGLPDIYNHALQTSPEHDVVIFIHDDVWIEDLFLADHVLQGLERFDIIGIAGNRRRVDKQPAWAFVDDAFSWDERSNLSGAIGQGQNACGPVLHFGPSGIACELLDGVFLAMRKSTLHDKNVCFDPRFKFHFYDMDFCRTARQQHLNLGTWTISLTHQSYGSFSSEEWRKGLVDYLNKWGS